MSYLLPTVAGVESTHHSFHAPVYVISMQMIQKWFQMIAGIFIYTYVESLNTILSCMVLPWGGAEVSYFDRGNFSAFCSTIFDLNGQYIGTSNES